MSMEMAKSETRLAALERARDAATGVPRAALEKQIGARATTCGC